MKLFLSALCASFMIAPLSFADDCEKGKCDKEKKEGTVLSACDKCDCEKCKDDKCADCDKCKKAKDGLQLASDCDKCKKGDEKKEEGTLAHCGKCGKDKDKHEEDEKKEGTFA